jgi:hypothetical protein
LANSLVEEKIHCIVIGKPKTRIGLSQSESGTPDQHYGVQNTGYMFRLLLFIREKCTERGVRFIDYADPQRKGEVDDPESKLYASRDLLAQGLIGSSTPMPTEFKRKHFRYEQVGKGNPTKKQLATKTVPLAS